MLSPVRLSVCLSVTRVDHTKTVEDRIMKLAPSGSPMILVFWRQISSQNFKGFPRTGASKKGGVWKFSNFLAWKMIGKGFVLFKINSSPSAFYIIKPTCIVIGFYPRDAMLARVIVIATCPSVCPSVCASVRLSVMRRYCVKTKKACGMISSPSGSPTTLVFWRQISSPNSKGFPPNGSLKEG